MFDGEFEPRYEENLYLVYNPSANLASVFDASTKIFSNSEKQSLSNLKSGLKGMSLKDFVFKTELQFSPYI